MSRSRILRYNSQLDTAYKRTALFVREGQNTWKDIDDEIKAVEKAKKNAEEMLDMNFLTKY